jgi:hypothetical protein
MVYLAMPEGVDRSELLSEYASETGLTIRKAEEHLELLESTGRLRYDDMRIYTTPKGLRWAGYISQEIQDGEEGRVHTNAQRAPAAKDSPESSGTSSITEE